MTFGPQLIGETEKTLNAILTRVLADTGLDERGWVTLRIAQQNTAITDLRDVVADRAHFDDAGDIIDDLEERGWIQHNALTGAGTQLVGSITDQIATLTAPIWDQLPDDDVAATERTLRTVIDRARAVLTGQ